jgi:DNA sulfur modification protein DndB
MGSTPYYNVTMKAHELLATTRPVRETDAWAGMGLEDRLQRDIDLRRVRTELVPYYANHQDRFNGSFVVLVMNGELEFEALEQFCNIPAAYKSPARKMGFLTVSGDEADLVVLDGQHRYRALREILQDDEVPGPYASEVPNDEMSVIFIEHQSDNPQKSRRIFNKINRYAKPTSRSDNIITSEDDGNAIVARWILNPEYNGALPTETRESVLKKDSPYYNPNAPKLVNWTSNTLAKGSRELTTLSTVYHTVEDILSAHGFSHFDERSSPVAPSEERLKEAFELANTYWASLMDNIDAFQNALAYPEKVSAWRYDGSHPYSLALRPVGQMALVKGLTMARNRSISEGDTKPRLDHNEAIKRANNIDWRADAPMWAEVLVRPGGRMNAGKNAVRLAGELVAYLIGAEYMTDEDSNALLTKWNEARGKNLNWAGMSEDDLDPEDQDRVDEIPEPLPDRVV